MWFNIEIRITHYLTNYPCLHIFDTARQNVTAVVSENESEFADMGLAVQDEVYDVNKQEYRYHITAINYAIDVVNKFVYFGSTVTSKNDGKQKIKHRITLVTRCYYGIRRHLNRTKLSSAMELMQYKRLLVLCFVFDRKVLHKTFSSVRVGDNFRIRTDRAV